MDVSKLSELPHWQRLESPWLQLSSEYRYIKKKKWECVNVELN